MFVNESKSVVFRRRLDGVLGSLPPFTHLVLATHVRALPSDLSRWADGNSMPLEFRRMEIDRGLDEFLTWPDDVFSHIVLLVRISFPVIAKQLHDQLDVTAEELLQWADGENLPNGGRRTTIMELLMRNH